MAQIFNGADLVTEYSQLLSDTSTTFQTKVLRWINEGIIDIASRADWPKYFVKGKKVLTADAEEQDLALGAPSAPSVAISAGGSLTADSDYTVLVTFYEGVSGVESIAGTASSTATPTGASLTIDLTSVDTSSDPLVTARKIYLSKDGAAYYYYSTISDNTTTTASITADTSSTIEPPDYSYINKLAGNPFLETSSQLEYQDFDQIRLFFQGAIGSGTPEYYFPMRADRLLMYPAPSTALTLSFYYYRRPNRVFNDSTSQPDMDPEVKEALTAYVEWRGFQYRDRDGVQSRRNDYYETLQDTISRMLPQGTEHGYVRDVMDTVGFW